MPYFLSLACLILTIFTSGCGLTPVLEPQDYAKEPQRFFVKVTGKPEESEIRFQLRKNLDIFLPTISKKYDRPLSLDINITTFWGDIALTEQAKVLRSQGQLYAHIVIPNPEPETDHTKPLIDTTVSAITSYTVDDLQEFSILSAESGARSRLIQSLAQDIVHAIQLGLKLGH